MGSSTPPPWSIPYPVGTDLVMNGDNAMQTMAERIAVLFSQIPPAPTIPPPLDLHTPYVPIQITNTAWGGSLGYVIRTGWVFILLACTRASWPMNQVITTAVPAVAQPSWPINNSGVQISSAAASAFGVNGGTITAYTPSTGSGGGVSGFITYPAK